MNIFVVLNESKPKDASDVHESMACMKEKSLIKNYEIYSYVYEMKNKSTQIIITEIYEKIISGGFKIVLWMHPTYMKLIDDDFRKLNKLKKSGVVFGLWSGDNYAKYSRRIPRAFKQLGAVSDAAFLQGVGYFSREMKKLVPNVEFVPGAGDAKRFHNVSSDYKYDVVLIGNNYKRDISFLSFSGSKLRRKLVNLFSKEFGDKFAVFGLGWEKYKCNHGFVDYTQQSEVYSHTKIVIGTNNLSSKYYFSDRLPIAMLSGKPVVYHDVEGMSGFFKGTGVFFYMNEYEALKIVKDLLSGNNQRFEKYKTINNEFAKSKLLVEHIMEYMTTYLISLSANTKKPENPWLEEECIRTTS